MRACVSHDWAQSIVISTYLAGAVVILICYWWTIHGSLGAAACVCQCCLGDVVLASWRFPTGVPVDSLWPFRGADIQRHPNATFSEGHIFPIAPKGPVKICVKHLVENLRETLSKQLREKQP